MVKQLTREQRGWDCVLDDQSVESVVEAAALLKHRRLVSEGRLAGVEYNDHRKDDAFFLTYEWNNATHKHYPDLKKTCLDGSVRWVEVKAYGTLEEADEDDKKRSQPGKTRAKLEQNAEVLLYDGRQDVDDLIEAVRMREVDFSSGGRAKHPALRGGTRSFFDNLYLLHKNPHAWVGIALSKPRRTESAHACVLLRETSGEPSGSTRRATFASFMGSMLHGLGVGRQEAASAGDMVASGLGLWTVERRDVEWVDLGDVAYEQMVDRNYADVIFEAPFFEAMAYYISIRTPSPYHFDTRAISDLFETTVSRPDYSPRQGLEFPGYQFKQGLNLAQQRMCREWLLGDFEPPRWNAALREKDNIARRDEEMANITFQARSELGRRVLKSQAYSDWLAGRPPRYVEYKQPAEAALTDGIDW